MSIISLKTVLNIQNIIRLVHFIISVGSSLFGILLLRYNGWTLNKFTMQSITAYNYKKFVNKFDMIWISESYLDSSLLPDNRQLNIKVTSWLKMIIREM